MPVEPPQPPAPNPVPPGPNTVRQVCTNALYELNVVAPGEVPDMTSELQPALNKFNQLLDSWSAKKIYIFVLDLVSTSPVSGDPFLLVPSLSPHTIGPAPVGNAPAPTFQLVGERPVNIKNINVILNNVTPSVRFPLNKRDKDWWAANRVQTIQTTLPTDFYYRPDWPLGSIFFWPVPNYAYGAEIEVETFLQGAATLDTAFAFPPGYELAITLTLAELLCPSFEKQLNPTLVGSALQARQVVAGLNALPPRISLGEFGPSTEKPRASWNYRTGLSNP